MPFNLGFTLGSARKREPEKRKEPSYHAVSICAGKNACEAAKGAAGKRVLPAEARLLPLPDCDRRERGSCSYRHHDDRRDGPRRQAEGAPPSGASSHEDERRQLTGRRAEDRLELDAENAVESADSNLVSDTYYGYGQSSGGRSS